MDASLTQLYTDLTAAQNTQAALNSDVQNAVESAAAAALAAAQAHDRINRALVAEQEKVSVAVASAAAADTAIYVLNERIRVATDPLVKPPVVVPPADPNAMPTDTPVGMKLLMQEDFLTDVPRGGVLKALTARGWAFYDGFKDSKKVGLYATDRVSLTKAGNLQLDIRSEAGQPLAFCGLPTAYNAQTYGRYEVRFRADDVAGYKIAWLLWPKSGNWNEGEIDFPEGGLGKTIWGFNHKVGAPSVNAAWVDTKTLMTGWHTAVIEWLPGSLKFILDGKVVLSSNVSVPTTPMRWTLQCETNLEGTPIDPAAAGKIEIAYVRVHVPA